MYVLRLFLLFVLCAISTQSYAANITVPKPSTGLPKKAKAKLPLEHPPVHILGKEVIPGSNKKRIVPRSVEILPENLQTERARAAIAMRRDMNIYKHNPYYGPIDAPITIIEMTDLNCLQCMTFLKGVDEVLKQEKYTDKVRYVHVHLPVDLYNSTNPAAFYGKIAQEQGVFWEYRKQLFSIAEIKDNTFIDKLVNVGGNPIEIRNLVRFNARKFYKELDADALSAKNMGETRPPVLFVNGIKVGYNIKIEELASLLDYELDMSE
jgi:protein-disulfide isomerase